MTRSRHNPLHSGAHSADQRRSRTLGVLGALSILLPMALVAVVSASIRYAVRPVPQAGEAEWAIAFGILQAFYVAMHELGHVLAGRAAGCRYKGFALGPGRVGVFLEPTTNRQQIAVSLGGPLFALLVEAFTLAATPYTSLLWAAALTAGLLDFVHLVIGVAMPNADSRKFLLAAYETVRGRGREPFAR